MTESFLPLDAALTWQKRFGAFVLGANTHFCFELIFADNQGQSTNLRQGSEFLKPGSKDSGVRSISSMPPPRKLVEPASCMMPPPPPMNTPLPPPPRNMSLPPPKFFAPQSAPKIESSSFGLNDSMPPPLSTRTAATKSSSVQSHPKKQVAGNTNGGSVSDTLLKLMEYGDEDDDIDDAEELVRSSPVQKSVPKPFWAV